MTQPQFISIIVFFSLVFIITIVIINNNRKKRKLFNLLQSRWGTKNPEHLHDLDFKKIRSYFDIKKDDSSFFIDDITWNDLNMDTIMKNINRTHSSVGEEYLYSMLRLPSMNKQDLLKKEELITLFKQDSKLRLSLQYLISKLGFINDTSISRLLSNEELIVPKSALPFIALSLSFMLSPLMLFVNPGFSILLIMFFAIFNYSTWYKQKSKLSFYIQEISYAVSLIATAKKLHKTHTDFVNKTFPQLLDSIKKINKESIKNYALINTKTVDGFMDYFKIFALLDIIVPIFCIKTLIKNRNELHEIFTAIGYLDSLISVASYRESLECYSLPKFVENKTLKIVDLYHPLIKDPVPNSVDIVNHILLTGSNASGKSTFLKTCSINVLLAQSINTCLAKSYEACFLRLYSSMALKDDIISGESYYIVEIKSLKRILDSLNDEIPIFCVVDEVLRGTNTIERVAASSEILRYLSKNNCITIAATHDLELVEILSDCYTFYHFQEKINENNIVFDYKLYEGPTKSKNAIKLLALMGFDKGIIERAEKQKM